MPAAIVPIILTADFPPDSGGIQRYMFELALAYGRLGRATVVVAPDHDDAKTFDREQPFVVLRTAAARSRAGRVWNLRGGVVRALRQHSGTVIASSWNPAAIAALAAGGEQRLHVIAHGSEIAHQRGPLRRRLLRYVLERSARVFAVSSYTAGLIEEAGAHPNLAILPPGVRAAECVRARAAVPTILSVARLIPRKGIDRLIDALALVRAQIPGAVLRVVGSGPDELRLRLRARAAGVSGAVHFAGRLDDRELQDAYAQAWCFALPARREGDDVEGFGLVYLEAGAAGVPSVGGRGSGADDAIVDGETGLLVDRGRPRHRTRTRPAPRRSGIRGPSRCAGGAARGRADVGARRARAR